MLASILIGATIGFLGSMSYGLAVCCDGCHVVRDTLLERMRNWPACQRQTEEHADGTDNCRQMSNGMMKMRKMDQGLEIKPGETVKLKPGSYHLMFNGLREGLKQGQTIKGHSPI